MAASRSRRRGPTPRRRAPVPSAPAPPRPSGWRARLERRSAGLLSWLSVRPWALPVLVVVLLVPGGLLPARAGVPLLTALLVVLAWLATLSWPALSPRGRGARLFVLVLVAAFASARAL